MEEKIKELEERLNKGKTIQSVYDEITEKMKESCMLCEYVDGDFVYRDYEEGDYCYEEVRRKKDVYKKLLDSLVKMI